MIALVDNNNNNNNKSSSMAGLDSKSCIDWCGVTVLAGRDGAQLSNGSQKPASPLYNDVPDGPSSLIRTFEMFPSVVQASALRD